MEKPDFNGLEPGGLDAEFYNYLSLYENEKDEQEKLNALLPVAEAQLQAELDARDFPRVYDTDRETQMNLMISTAFELTQQYLEEAEAENSDNRDVSENEYTQEAALLEATEFIYAQQSEEAGIAKLIRAQLQLYQYKLDEGATEESLASVFTDDKKKIMAAMLSTNPAIYDDGWYDLVRDVVPGEPLDISSPEDAHYVDESIDWIAEENRENIRLFDDIVATLERVQNETGNAANNPKEAMFLRAAARDFIRTINGPNSGKDNARAERELKLWEIARQYEINDEAVRQIIAIATKENPL